MNLMILSREKAAAVVLDHAVRVTIQAMMLRGPLTEFLNTLHDEGFFLAEGTPETTAWLETKWTETDKPEISGAELLDEDYAVRYLQARTEKHRIPLPAAYAEKIIELLYAKHYVCGFVVGFPASEVPAKLKEHNVKMNLRNIGAPDAIRTNDTAVGNAGGCNTACKSPAADSPASPQ
jgi:hypothetical protein